MKDITLILITTTIALIAWIGFEIFEVTHSDIVPPKLLELSTPISGRIDVEFIKELYEDQTNPNNK